MPNGATGWFEEAERCVWCANNQEPVRGMCYDDIMSGAYECNPTDAAGNPTAAVDPNTPENCFMCRNQEHWRPEMKYCVECNAGFFLNSNQECVSLTSNGTAGTTTHNHCVESDPNMPFMVEHST
jgi:hypothetical protein